MSTFPYKNAADYGFLPGRDADENTAALQDALNGGVRSSSGSRGHTIFPVPFCWTTTPLWNAETGSSSAGFPQEAPDAALMPS